MPIHIKHRETEALAHRVAELTGETLPEAIRVSVAERDGQVCRAQSGRTVRSELNAIALRCASRTVIGNLTDDEILGYDVRE